VVVNILAKPKRALPPLDFRYKSPLKTRLQATTIAGLPAFEVGIMASL
jgi:hypothetical protein